MSKNWIDGTDETMICKNCKYYKEVNSSPGYVSGICAYPKSVLVSVYADSICLLFTKAEEGTKNE